MERGKGAGPGQEEDKHKPALRVGCDNRANSCFHKPVSGFVPTSVNSCRTFLTVSSGFARRTLTFYGPVTLSPGAMGSSF